MEIEMSTFEHNTPVSGYPRLAQEMGNAPSIAMVRRFTDLSNESLLYFQAQLVILERELHDLQARDARLSASIEPKPKPRCSRDWYWLGIDSPECDQWNKVLEIRQVLKEYEEAVLRQLKLNSLNPPSKYDLDDIQTRFKHSAMSSSDRIGLIGEDEYVWGSKVPSTKTREAKDLVALSPRPESDPFSTFIMERCTPWLYQHLRKINETIFVNDRTQLRYTAMLTTVVASLLPIASIAVLYSSKSTKVRIGLVAIFTFIFASSLVCFTTAKRTDVFSATAA
ncbi:MAG: hypothetical protein Q9160_007816 [Pyrenula sp. 1 TL-2023]